MNERIRVAVIRCGDQDDEIDETVALWAGSCIWERRGFLLELLEAPLPQAQAAVAVRSALHSRLARADAFVFVVPAGKSHDPPPSPAHGVDSTSAEWRDKPVAFISHGDTDGGRQVVERLRPVFTALQAVVLRDGVHLADADDRFDDGGELRATDPAHGAMDALLARLQCHALRLREVRTGPRLRTQSTRAQAD